MSVSGDPAAHPALAVVHHRPWPLPPGRWVWQQSWQDLLFAHWPVPVADVQRLLPRGLHAQTCAGSAWLGIVPFRMAGVTRRPLPVLPVLSTFPELNVRVYVERDGKPGVWFLSLDASSRLAVLVGRLFYHAPYHLARIGLDAAGSEVRFQAARRGAAAAFAARYQPVSPATTAVPGSLEHFLTERYCLYAQAPDGTIYRTEVHHPPWPLQAASAAISENSVSAAGGLALEGPPAVLHFSRGVDVVIWPARPAR